MGLYQINDWKYCCKLLILRSARVLDLDEELRGFLEMAAEEKMKEGMSRKDALRAVRLERGASKSRRKSSALPAGNLFSRPCCGTRATRSDACEWLQHSPSPRC
jgi:hypothetical protein